MRQVISRPPVEEHSKIRNYYNQFQVINNQNQELIRLADSITRSSFMQPQYPPIIVSMEKELRRNLSIFVDSIRDFFVEMDSRIRALGGAIEQKLSEQENDNARLRQMTMHSDSNQGPRGRPQMSNQNIVLKINQMNSDPYQRFSDRIEMLETNLKKTQENEEKLLEIVDKLSKKTENYSSISNNSPQPQYLQPPLRKPPSEFSLKSNLKTQSEHQTSFRLFSLKNKTATHPSQVQKNRTPSYSPFFCNSPPNNPVRQTELKPIPQKPYTESRNPINYSASSNSHRASYMLKALNT